MQDFVQIKSNFAVLCIFQISHKLTITSNPLYEIYISFEDNKAWKTYWNHIIHHAICNEFNIPQICDKVSSMSFAQL